MASPRKPRPAPRGGRQPGLFDLIGGAAKETESAVKTVVRAPPKTVAKAVVASKRPTPPPTPPPPPPPKPTPPTTRAPYATPAAQKAAQGVSDRIAAQKAFRKRYLDTVRKVRSGKMTEAEGGAYLKGLGFPDSKNPYVTDEGITPIVHGVAHGATALANAVEHPESLLVDTSGGITHPRPGIALKSTLGLGLAAAGAGRTVAPAAVAALAYPGEKLGEVTTGRKRQPTQIEQQAGIVPTDAVEHAARLAVQTVPKVAAGGAGAVAGLARGDPTAWKGFGTDIFDSLVGVGQLAGLGVSATTDPQGAYKTGVDVIHGLAQQWMNEYGPDVTYGQVLAEANRHPFIYGTNALLAATPVVRGALALLGWRRGMTLGEAWKATHFPDKPRTLRYQTTGTEKPGTGAWFRTSSSKPGDIVSVEIPRARNPITRGTVQAGYDAVSKIVNHMGSLRKLPISESKRAARAMRKQLDRKLKRLPAEVQGAFVDVTSAIRGDDEHYATALATMLQKPNGFSQEEWVTAVIEDLRDMIENPTRFRLPAQNVSPAMQRRLNEINGLETKAQAALMRRRDVAHRRLGADQQRFAGAIDEVMAKQRALDNERDRIEQDPGLSPEDRQNELDHLDAESSVLDTQLSVARRELGHVSVDQPPIEAPSRDALRARLEQLKYFKRRPQRIEDALALTDAVARRWASQVPGREPAEWYAQHTFTGDAADIPTGPGARLFHQLSVDHITSPLKPSDKEILTNANRARQVRAHRRGQTTYSHLKADGSETQRNVPATAADTHSNVPTFDDQGRLLFGGETQYPDLQARWEEGFRRSFPDASDAEIRQKMLDAAAFYEEKVFPFLGRVLSTREVQAWLASQKGASPERGLLDLTKTIEKVIRKEDLGPTEIGLAAQTMAKIIYGNRDIAEGAAAKLTDFSDVGHVNTVSRTYTGHHPGTGVPYVADRWEARAKGKVDPDFIESLYREHDAALQSQGYISRADWEGLRRQASDGATAWATKRNKEFARKKVKNAKGEIRTTTLSERDVERDRQLRQLEADWERDSGQKVIKADPSGGLGAAGYEHVSDWGHGLIDYLNQTKYLGKDDWNAASGQALDWAGFQHYVGAAPENVDWALFRQEKPVAFEIEGVGRLQKKFPRLKNLPADAKFALNKYIVDHIVDLAAERTGVIPLRTTIGYGGWLTHVSPAIRIGVLAGERSYRNFLDFLREVTGEEEVFGVEGGSRGKYTEIAIRAEALKDPQLLQSLWQALREKHPEFSGFTPDPAGGLTSVLIAEDGAPVARTGAAFQREVGATLEQLEKSLGTDDLKVEFRAVQPVRSTRQQSAIDQYLEETYGHVPEQHRRPGASGRQHLRGGGEAARKTEARFRASRADKASVDAKIQEALDIYDSEGVGGLERRAKVSGRIDDPEARPHTTRDPDAGRKISATHLKFAKATGEPIKSVLHLNQSRGGDILGSTAWLATEPGRRTIYLAENADFSTLVHELFGHATEEMRTAFPDEFQAVQLQMGKPYADWTVEDHEQFAKWMENYFRTGYAPTPELVPVFDRVKGWMRAIYQGLVRTLGGRIPVQTRQLFDSYFGAAMDENVWRVTAKMNGEPWDPEITGDMSYGIEAERRAKQLASIKKGVETRSYNRSQDKMVGDLEAATAKMDALHAKGEEMTPEEFDTYLETVGDVLVKQAEIVVRADKREQALRKKLADLEKSLAKGFDNRRFEGALEAMKFLSEDRERILKKAFGDHYDAVFSNRRDLLAEWLVSKGLLKADYEKGTGFYYPMMLPTSRLDRQLKVPAAPLAGDVIGKTREDLLNLHKQNNMILWQRGDWSADPAVLLEAHQRAQSYAFMNEVKDLLWSMGREMTPAEREKFPAGMYILNPDGTAISTELRAQLNDARLGAAEDANKIQDGLANDQVALENKLKDYFTNFAIDPNHVPADFLGRNHAHLRVIPKGVVDTVLRPLQGGRSPAGKALDAATTVARFATIYANFPGYMIANGANNIILNLAQMGVKLPLAMARSRRLFTNPKLRYMIFAQTGDLPAIAAIQRGRYWNATLDAAERKYLNAISVVDRYPRAWAWLNAAALRGYTSEDDLFRLLRGETEKAARDREAVAEEATQHMIDFNRPRDWERQSLTRALFIWPFIRGATAWPFWYAKNYPERVALAGLAGQQLQERQKRMLGKLPYWYRDFYPVSTSGDRARIVSAGTISPTSVVEQQIQLMHDTIAGLLGKKPDAQTASWIDMFTPVLRDVFQLATNQNQYGTATSMRDLLQTNVLTNVVPGYRIADAMLHWDSGGKVPRIYQPHFRGGWNDARRTFLRIGPQTASISWLNAQAQTHGDVPTDERIKQQKEVAAKHWKQAGKSGQPDNRVTRGVVMQVVFEDRVKEYARERGGDPEFLPTQMENGAWDTKYHPSKFEQAQIAYAVMQRYVPAWIEHHKLVSPAAAAAAHGILPRSASADKVAEVYLKEFHAWTGLESKIDTAAAKRKWGTKAKAETPARHRRQAAYERAHA